MESINYREEEIKYLKDHKFFSIIMIKAEKLGNEIISDEIYEILKTLNNNNINLSTISNYVLSDVLTFQPSLRSLVWKLFLKYLPTNCEKWEENIDKKREEYKSLKNFNYDFPTSKFEDTRVLELIEKDIKRTYKNINFFNLNNINNEKETNRDVLKRLLFIFAKKYPKISYVQGFNVIIANIFYVFSQDQNPYFKLFVEEDTFFCFESLINDFEDIYIYEKDSTGTGIRTIINYIKYLIFFIDKKLFLHLQKMKIDLYAFLFKWYTIFFSHDFPFDVTLKIFDHILCNSNKKEYLTLLCVSSILIKKEKLLSNDIEIICNALQTFEPMDELFIFAKVPEITKIITDNAEMMNAKNYKNFLWEFNLV